MRERERASERERERLGHTLDFALELLPRDRGAEKRRRHCLGAAYVRAHTVETHR